jgi:copper chaperone CopZ
MKYILSIFLALLILSCESPTAKKTTDQNTKVCTEVNANTSLNLGVKGMVCKMGCGGSIRKALKATCAVEKVDVSFIDTLEEQSIIVYYDRSKVAPEQMISVLNTINDKQFEVRTLGKPQKL